MNLLKAGLIASLTLGTSAAIFLKPKVVEAHCRVYHPHHCGTNDIRNLPNQIPKEIDDCINGGGCSLPADEAWGEAGRIAYTTGLTTIAAKNSTLPAKSLSSWQKEHLRPYFGNLVDRVKIKYGATTLDNWRVGNFRISIPSDGQTFCNDIYITQRYNRNDRNLLSLITHEMVHSLQCERLGGASNFGYKYFKEYKRANQVYRNNKLEREAYDFAKKFNSEYASLERQISSLGVALDANGGQGIPYQNTNINRNNHNLHWKLIKYQDYYVLRPRVRGQVALSANGGRGNPYLHPLDHNHEHNLHWKLIKYQDYYVLRPRVREQVALSADGGRGNPYLHPLNNNHEHNLHWRLTPVGSYYIISPRVSESCGGPCPF